MGPTGLLGMEEHEPATTRLAKRPKIPYHHKHRIQHRPPVVAGPIEPGLLPQDLVDKLLIESIKIICEEQASKLGINAPYIDSVALEALRNAMDEFVQNLCQKVCRSMHAARRTVPIPLDLDDAFYALDLPLPDDQLRPYATHPPVNRSLPTPPPDDEQDEFHKTSGLPDHVLGSELSRQQDLKRFSFNVQSLPPVPSAHTYRDTEVYLERETDSKRIRELATEEGKLGEQALRKLAGAVKLGTALSTEPELKHVKDRRPRRLRKRPVLTEEAMFEETMRHLLRAEKGDFELGPVVSSEKQYRMPDEGRVRRRQLNTLPPQKQTAESSSSSGATKYNLLPPPLRKPKPAASHHADLTFEL